MNFFERLGERILPSKQQEIFVGATDSTYATFNDKRITYTGSMENLNYDTILRDKQGNIVKLFQLCDYFVDKDPLIRGIVKGVYTPFSTSSRYYLDGVDEKVKKSFLDYYKQIDFEDKMRSIFFQLYKYANVYVYVMPNGNIITLPVHRIRIANMIQDGEPILEFDVASIRQDLQQNGEKADKNFLKDDLLEQRLKGFPPEVVKAVKSSKSWVQLDPKNTFVLQELKEDWCRYAIPMITSCLGALSKKAMIESYERRQLAFGGTGFVHVRYGDEKNEIYPDNSVFALLQRLFGQAMKETGLVITNNMAKAEVINPDLRYLFEHDKYKDVNDEILSAGGISAVIVSGQTDSGSSFASAKVSMETAVMRIMQAQKNFSDMMNKIHLRVAENVLGIKNTDKVPQFHFEPIDLATASKYKDVCMDLWKQGTLSSTTLLQNYGIDVEQEIDRLKKEEKIPVLRREEKNSTISNSGEPKETGKQGRPVIDENKRTTDIEKSMTGKQPKPSNPNGSL